MDFSELGRKYSRYLLVIFNFIFALTGVLILSVGISIKAYFHEYGTFLENKYFYASDLLIVIGVIIFLISFFGCCGALRENACMTLTFSSLLIVIFILELIVGIGGILLKHKTEDVVEKALTDTMTRYGKPNETEITVLWDNIQTNFHCCGVHNSTDWINNNATNSTNTIPISCCKFAPGSRGSVTCDKADGLYEIGCLTVFSDYIEGHASSIEGVGLGLAIIQLLGIVLSCYLSKKIKSDYETV